METLKFLMVVAVVAVAISAINFVYMAAFAPTGYAQFDEGNITLEISSVIELNFTRNLLDWGSGSVDGAFTYAYLDSEGTNTNDIGWNTVSQGLILESLSNENVTINLSVNNNSVWFLDDGVAKTPASKVTWKASGFNFAGGAETACASTLALGTYTEIPTTIGSQITLCDNFGFYPTNNEVEIDIGLNISVNAPAGTGQKEAVITASAMACAGSTC